VFELGGEHVDLSVTSYADMQNGIPCAHANAHLSAHFLILSIQVFELGGEHVDPALAHYLMRLIAEQDEALHRWVWCSIMHHWYAVTCILQTGLGFPTATAGQGFHRKVSVMLPMGLECSTPVVVSVTNELVCPSVL
jgi:hypothetical protein